jgi:hypothetical protein
MFTVALGILIALALDGIVTWGHHRMLVQEARPISPLNLWHGAKVAMPLALNLPL